MKLPKQAPTIVASKARGRNSRLDEMLSGRFPRGTAARGSGFEENEAPFVISGTGFEIAATPTLECH
jgi:hypothetical protein